MLQTPGKTIMLVFVGEKLSGKEKSARYLIKKHRFVGLRFSKILVDILRRLRLPVTRLNEAQLVGALRERFGGGVLAAVIKTEITKKHLKRVVVDGLRHPAEYDILKRLPGFKLIYLTAPLLVRYRRALARREKVGENKFTLNEFKNEETLPTELFIKRLGKKAEVKLINDSTFDKLYQQIEQKIIKKLK
ncbi:MAG: hypothetical protein HY973_02255 [Candidatus Kerfeldbacteria bacterium]|nr:hypothetical protein [Candidatus Kerfeldbacteria bacterium]